MRKRILHAVAALLLAIVPLAANGQTGIAEQVRGDTNEAGFVASILHWYDSHMNYYAVGGLMTLESSFIPFPSEVVIPPAVYVALDEHSQSGMNWWMVVLFGTLGAMLGAILNYLLSLWLGRPIVYAFAESRVGRLFQLSREKIERAERYFNEHGNLSTLVGRFIPVIRQLISIPAGLARMHFGSFCLFTFLGALAWNCILALLGYLAHLAGDISVVERYSHEISIAIVALLAAAVLLFAARWIIKKKRKK